MEQLQNETLADYFTSGLIAREQYDRTLLTGQYFTSKLSADMLQIETIA